MKLLVMGDFHESNHVPRSRVDDFHETKKQLIAEINGLAKQHNCRAILQMGDFLDKNVLPHAVLMDIVKRWKPHAPAQQLQKLQNGEISVESFLEAIKEDIPLIGVVGNHELIGNSLNTLPKTSIYLLKEMGFMQLVDRQNPVIFKDEETGQTVAITGTHYHKNMDMPGYESDYIVDEKLGDIHIHLVHGYGEVKATPWPHTLVSQFLPHTLADLTICGHDHKAAPLIESNGKKYFNPGSPQKIKADEIGEKPQVALLTITEKGVNVEFIPLQTGSNTEEIISRERIEEKKLQEQKLAEIKSTVTKASLEERLTIVDIAREISDNQHFPEHIKEDVTKRLEAMMGALTKEHHTVNPYYIERMIIKNFQSHKDTTIEFDPGLNVFIGESGEGKSALQRAFWFVFDKSKINPKNFIHKGEKECSVTLELSNKTSIKRFVTSTGKNGYEIYDSQTGQSHEGNTTLAPLAQQLLGYAPLALDEKTTMPLNFMKQGEGWYFIGNHVTSPMRAKVIGSFYQTHYADAVMKDLENESKKLVTELKQVNGKVEELDERLVEYQYLDGLEERLALVSQKQEELMDSIKRYQTLRDLYVKKVNLEDSLSRHESALQELSPRLEDVTQRYVQLNEQAHHFQRLIHLRNQLVVSKQEEQSLVKRSESLIPIEQLLTSQTRLSQTVQQYQSLYQRYVQLLSLQASLTQGEQLLTKTPSAEPMVLKLTELKTLSNQFYQQHRMLQFLAHRLAQYRELEHLIQLAESYLTKFPDMSQIESIQQTIRENLEKQSGLTQLYRRLIEIVTAGRQESARLAQCKQFLESTVLDYRTVLNELKQCPVCLSEISNDTVDHIVAKQLNQTIK